MASPSAETGPAYRPLPGTARGPRDLARAFDMEHVVVWKVQRDRVCAARGVRTAEGVDGVFTHAHLERVPIIENSQDYEALSAALKTTLDEHPDAHGVLLSRHGLYTWGQSVAEARRHLEALEFLFEVEGRRLSDQPA